jgi:hypothetical protein
MSTSRGGDVTWRTVAEQWAPIYGHEAAYEVSDLGRVRSLNRVIQRRDGTPYPVRGQMMRTHLKDGYPAVSLNGGKRRGVRIHVLVLEAFAGPRPEGMEACHNNGNSTDCRLTNLRWDTVSENRRDLIRHGTHAQARKTHCLRRHPLIPGNLIPSVVRRGGRSCYACDLARGYLRKHPEAEFQATADRYFKRLIDGMQAGGQP